MLLRTKGGLEMSKKLLILAAALSVALIGTSFAAVENIKVSGDVTSQAISRNLTLGLQDTSTVSNENFLFT